MKRIASFAACVLLAMVGMAQAQSFISDGVATGQAETEFTEFGADYIIMNTRLNYTTLEMEDPTHPMNFLNGPCFGFMELRGGAAESGGVCVFDGFEGDKLLLGWTARRIDPRGQIHGYWTVNAGTGILLQASGGGTFISNVNSNNGSATNTLKGAITLR